MALELQCSVKYIFVAGNFTYEYKYVGSYTARRQKRCSQMLSLTMGHAIERPDASIGQSKDHEVRSKKEFM